MDKNVLHDWVFHYNTYTEKWNATKRDSYVDLFSKSNSKNIISSSEVSTLVELIIKGKGDIAKINELVK
jgi:hypothetical protein